MRKLCIYVDPSVLGWALNQGNASRHAEANVLLAHMRRGRVVGFCSWLTEEEIAAAPAPIESQLREKLEGAKMKLADLALKEEAEELASRYCDDGVVPRQHFADALHVAIATLIQADALVSYNFAHLVSLETMVRVNEVNRELGLQKIFICQPQEVIGHEGT